MDQPHKQWRMMVYALAFCAGVAASRACAEEDLIPSARIAWQPDIRVKRAEGVYPSPHDPCRIWVCTPQGIMETLNDGESWNLLPNSSREQLGRISDIVFSPIRAEWIYLGSREKGVFRSIDNGKTWENIGTLQTGLKALQVVRLGAPAIDRTGKTIYAAHGDAATGISKTIDGGKTWVSIANELYAEELLVEGREMLMAAHSKQEQDLWSIYQANDAGDSWLEVVRDVRPTVSGVNRSTLGSMWFGVLKGRLLHRDPLGRHQKTGEWIPVGPEEGSWASIFSTMGKKPDQDVVYAYDPHKWGLVASTNHFKTWWQENEGLFIGRLVKEGANITVTANGETFYASINGQLYVGRIAEPEGPVITKFTVTPNVVHFSETGTASIVISAQVAPMDKDPKSKLTHVYVNLGALKGPGNFPLFDDGKHGDGAAGDGQYAAAFEMKGDFLRQWWAPEKRWGLPGQIMIDLAARDVRGRILGQKAPLSVFAKPQNMVFWDGDAVRWGGRMVEGRRGSYNGKFDSSHGIIFEIEEQAHEGQRCMHVVSLHGPWLTGWGQDSDGRNLSGLEYLSFWIKAIEPTHRDLKVLLTDAPGGENDARHSTAVWLIKGGYLKEFTTEYQKVRIPIAKLLSETGFNIEQCGGIAFGGDDPNGHNVFVDDVRFEIDEIPAK